MRKEIEDASTETPSSPQILWHPSGDGHWRHAESPRQISAAPNASSVDAAGDEEEFEFAFVVKDPEPGISADEIFSDGKIRSVYPVFNRSLLVADGGTSALQPLRRLLMEHRNRSISSSSSSSSSSSLGDELEGIPDGTYCVWKPGSAEQTPERIRKSSSTGSSTRWRFRDLVLGRSHSDGKEKFHFLSVKEKSPPEKDTAVAVDGMLKGKKSTDLDLVSAHRMYYGKKGMAATSSASGRRSYLPYKPSVVGFFGGGNGLRRVHHPF